MYTAANPSGSVNTTERTGSLKAWKPGNREDGWGYGSEPASGAAFAERYAGLTKVFPGHPRICVFCCTQLTDIGQEQNGLCACGRPKFSEETCAKIREANVTRAAVE